MAPAGLDQLEQLIQRILNLSVGAAFIIVLVMLVVAGIKFLTSGGEQKGVKQGADTVTWALLGILFLALAWLILRLVAAFTNHPELLKFCLDFNGCK